MKHSNLFILGSLLILTVHYSKCQRAEPMPYKEWYEKIVMHCTPGSKIDSYKPHMVCICREPGYIESCQYTGMRRPVSDSSKTTLIGKYDKILTQAASRCQTNPPPGRWTASDGCNWCYCLGKTALCTKMQCIKNGLTTTRMSCKDKPLGKFKHEDGCNWCYCMDTNTPICTRMECVKNGNQLSKKPNMMMSCRARNPPIGKFLHPDGCNSCWCVGKIPMCTLMRCIEPVRLKNKETRDEKEMLIKKKMSLKEMAQNCKRGTNFKEPNGCSICSCIEDGVVICPHKICP